MSRGARALRREWPASTLGALGFISRLQKGPRPEDSRAESAHRSRGGRRSTRPRRRAPRRR
eukprot:5317708-Pyramimonas_sp.AAC.1